MPPDLDPSEAITTAVGSPRATSRANVGPERTATRGSNFRAITWRATSDIRSSVPCSRPLVALTNRMEAQMRQHFAIDGTGETRRHNAYDNPGMLRAHNPGPRSAPRSAAMKTRKEHIVHARREHPLDKIGFMGPQTDTLEAWRQDDGERRSPTPGSDDRDRRAVSRRAHREFPKRKTFSVPDRIR